MEIRVFSVGSVLVELRDGGLQGFGVDVEFLREFGRAGGLREVTICQKRCQACAARTHHTQAVVAQCGGITHQIGRNTGTGFVGFLHRQPEAVVRGAFIQKALPGLVDGDHAGFGPVHHEMGEHRLGSIRPLAYGYRGPKSVAGTPGAKAGTLGQGQVLRQTGGPWRAGAPLGRYPGQHLAAFLGVPVKAAAGQNDTAGYPDGFKRAALPQTEPADTALRTDQRGYLGGEQQRHVFLLRQRPQQATHQRIAHHPAGATRPA